MMHVLGTFKVALDTTLHSDVVVRIQTAVFAATSFNTTLDV